MNTKQHYFITLKINKYKRMTLLPSLNVSAVYLAQVAAHPRVHLPYIAGGGLRLGQRLLLGWRPKLCRDLNLFAFQLLLLLPDLTPPRRVYVQGFVLLWSPWVNLNCLLRPNPGVNQLSSVCNQRQSLPPEVVHFIYKQSLTGQHPMRKICVYLQVRNRL